MGFVDNAKYLHKNFLNYFCPQRVIFHHVPKCGGTSVGRALRKRYIMSQATVTPESSFRAFEAFTGRHDREKMLVDVLDLREQMMLYLLYEDIRCVSLHVGFSLPAHRIFSDRYRFVTILRDPVERFLSHYYWSHGKPNAHARIDEDFDNFLDTERALRLGATYVEFYSGLGKNTDLRANDSISAAVKNLKKFDVVGRLDDLKSFETQLQNALGVKISVGHENKSTDTNKDKKYNLNDNLREKVERICAPDIAVWEGFFNYEK